MHSSIANVQRDEFFILSSLPPSRAQKWFAFGIASGFLIVYLIISGPLSSVDQPRPNAAFVPAYAMAMFVIDAVTAFLLFAQFYILHSRAILVIASGYLYTALILIPWILTFPGIFAQTWQGGGQSTLWLYFFWHAGFPALVIMYALLKGGDPEKPVHQGSVGVAIALSIFV